MWKVTARLINQKNTLTRWYSTKKRNAIVHFFDSRPYAVRIHQNQLSSHPELYGNLKFNFITPKLDSSTARLVTANLDKIVPEDALQIASVFVQDDVNADVLKQFKDFGIEMIAVRSTGFDNVDVKMADELKITVCNVPAYSPESIAEFAVAMLMAINRKLILANLKVHSGNFSLDRLNGMVLKGKTVGVVGTGKIGMAAVDILLGLGMKVLMYDKYPNLKGLEDRRGRGGDLKYCSLEEIFKESHVISLHCPLTDETYHMINDETIGKMRDGVLLVNTSRGSLIDANAALRGLKSKKISGLGLDVLEGEKGFFFRDKTGEAVENDTLALLLAQPNVLITGHQAFFTNEALDTIAHTNMENIRGFVEGGLRGRKHGNSQNETF